MAGAVGKVGPPSSGVAVVVGGVVVLNEMHLQHSTAGSRGMTRDRSRQAPLHHTLS